MPIKAGITPRLKKVLDRDIVAEKRETKQFVEFACF